MVRDVEKVSSSNAVELDQLNDFAEESFSPSLTTYTIKVCKIKWHPVYAVQFSHPTGKTMGKVDFESEI